MISPENSRDLKQEGDDFRQMTQTIEDGLKSNHEGFKIRTQIEASDRITYKISIENRQLGSIVCRNNIKAEPGRPKVSAVFYTASYLRAEQSPLIKAESLEQCQGFVNHCLIVAKAISEMPRDENKIDPAKRKKKEEESASKKASSGKR